MKYFILVIALLSTHLRAEKQQPPALDEIRNSKAYVNAIINPIVDISKNKQLINSHKKAITLITGPLQKDIRKKVSVISQKLSALTDPNSTDFPLADVNYLSMRSSENYINFSTDSWDDKTRLSCDRDGKIISFSVALSDQTLDGKIHGNPKLFEAFSKQVFEIIHGHQPLGKADYQQVNNIEFEGNLSETCIWSHQDQDSKTSIRNTVTITHTIRNNHNSWNISTTSSETGNDIITDKEEQLLQNQILIHPVKLIEQEAYAIALKACDQAKLIDKKSSTFLHTSYNLKEHTLNRNLQLDESATIWKAKELNDPQWGAKYFCAKVELRGRISVFIDWNTKKILYITANSGI